MSRKIVIRADGNRNIGIGHITRCLYFIENLQENFKIIFCFIKNSLIKDFLLSHNQLTCELESGVSLEQELDTLSDFSSDKVILDIRNRSDDYYRRYSETFENILRFDDSDKSINIYSNLYLNYNLYSENINFNIINKENKLFLGPKYYILNPIFRKFEESKRFFQSKQKKILISMGGGDPKNLTIKITKAIINLEDIHLIIILGGLFKNYKEIESLKNENPRKITIYYNINNMPELMFESDIIIGTGGNISFEAAYMGVPGILINQIELQNQNGIRYEQKGIFKNGGLGENLLELDIRNLVMHLIRSEDIRRKFSKNGRELFKSEGLKEVIKEFLS